MTTTDNHATHLAAAEGSGEAEAAVTTIHLHHTLRAHLLDPNLRQAQARQGAHDRLTVAPASGLEVLRVLLEATWLVSIWLIGLKLRSVHANSRCTALDPQTMAKVVHLGLAEAVEEVPQPVRLLHQVRVDMSRLALVEHAEDEVDEVQVGTLVLHSY